MPLASPLDYLPLWMLLLATIVVVLLSVEAGYRLGGYRRRHSEQEKEALVGAMVAATIGLLAFMLAFTFGFAASRFEARRQVVVDEANAVGTTFLRAGLLPDQRAARIRKLLREYVDVRLEAIEPGSSNWPCDGPTNCTANCGKRRRLSAPSMAIRLLWVCSFSR